MKRLLLILIIACTCSINMQGQEIFKEVKKMQNHAEEIVNDTTKSLQVRYVACFKYDALYYLIDKASHEDNFSEYELGLQASAMVDFVDLFVKRLSACKKSKDKDMLKAKFRTATINNSLFHDTDKEVVYGYVDNDKYITQFSLDTDWVKALEEVK